MDGLGEFHPESEDDTIDHHLENVVVGEVELFFPAFDHDTESGAPQDVHEVNDDESDWNEKQFSFHRGGHGQDEADVEDEQFQSVTSIGDVEQFFSVLVDSADGGNLEFTFEVGDV